jgi:hypothetical protein
MTAKKPSKPIFSGYQTITLDPYCPYQTRVIGHIGQTFVSGYLAYLGNKVCYYTGDITTFFVYPPIFDMLKRLF